MIQFRLIHTMVRNLHCHELPAGESTQDTLNYSPIFDPSRPREFAVLFELKVPLASASQLDLDFLAIFETLEDITEEFRLSHFPRINAPAVAYPYIRAFVSQFAVLAGFDPCTLPIRNFTLGSPPATVAPAQLTDKP